MTETQNSQALQQENLHIGIDVGSTTVKLAILDDDNRVRFDI